MKTLLILLFFLGGSASAQSLYNAKANDKVSTRNTEDFTVTFEKTLTSYIYKRNDRLLTDDLKPKIEKFMNTTRFVEFRRLGLFELNVIKRKGKYYIVQQKFPERLISLPLPLQRRGTNLDHKLDYPLNLNYHNHPLHIVAGFFVQCHYRCRSINRCLQYCPSY